MKEKSPPPFALHKHVNPMVPIPSLETTIITFKDTRSPGDRLTIRLKYLAFIPVQHHNTK